MLWCGTIYLEESKKKLKFVQQYYAVKEYQKLKSLSQILVQQNIRQISIAQKGSATHSDVTILFCKINDF